ncbi:glycosyltransferase [Rhizobium sp. PAMB 3182]
MGFPESWIEKNPDWEYRFWTDDDLLAFFREERPDLLDLYLSYPRPVQRADLARYCILHRFGGLYADIDTRCLASIEPIAGDSRVILCEEPDRHRQPALVRGLDRLWFNGTMASPPEHPFWDSVIDLCRDMASRRDGDVLETTGPLVLTAAVRNWPAPQDLALNSCGLFADADVHGNASDEEPYGPFAPLKLSTHLWKGSWYKRGKVNWWRRKMARLRQLRDWLLGGPRLDPARTLAEIDMALLQQPPMVAPGNGSLLVLVPVRDAEADLARCFALLLALDHPRDRLHLRFGHGNSRDNTGAMLEEFIARHADAFASVGIVATDRNAPKLDRRKRWKPDLQRRRRSGIAKARNDLLDRALAPEHDWVLWIDADVVDYPPDIVGRLASSGGRIVVPNCVLDPGGPSFDLNTFLMISEPTRVELYRYIRDGLLQPPADWFPRRHLHDLRYLETVPLYGVGGTMILVDANCHRAGLRFPEKPYRHLIETEGFGVLARDAGITPIGMPKLEIIHARA